MADVYCPSSWTEPLATVDLARPDYVQPDGRRGYFPWTTAAHCPLHLEYLGLERIGCDDATLAQYAACPHGHHRELWMEAGKTDG